MATLSNVNTGSSPNDGTGDDLRTAFTTINSNFQAITGIFPNLDVADLAANITSTGTSTFNVLNGATIGNAAAAIVGGTVSAATIGNSGASLVGTISTAAQTNITSLGTLSGLTVSGTSTFNTGQVVVNAGLSIVGAITKAITELGGNTYALASDDNTVIANLGALGNTTVTLANSANNTSRAVTLVVYDPTDTANLVMTVQTNSGEGNIFISANAHFQSTDIGVDRGQNTLRLISNGQYWITI